MQTDMKPTSRLKILKALQEKKISQEEAFDALKQLQNSDKEITGTPQKAQQTQKVVDANKSSTEEIIAIVGLSGKFPGAANAEEFWENIKNGVDSVTEIPEDRWSVKEFYDQDRTAPEKTYSKWQGLVKDIEYFDPLFFNLSPREASFIDPQQRLFLEECWKTFEDAGFSPDDVMGSKCGVYVGAGEGDYIKRLKNETTMPYTLIGNSSAILSARISYLLNLKGPSMSINTACSGSLVAIHLAVQSILSGDCNIALAGGVYLQTEADLHVQTSKAGMLSEDGRCKAFDQSGNGFVPAEGVGVVLLKKLSEAERDGDHIYGVIRGSKINQDGSTNGITAPSADSQKNLEINCYEDFNINPSEISYVECHGTGTKLGDPIEIDALAGAFNKFTNQKQFCAIGSVKTNIGHALSAAGVASVIKVLMGMKYQQLAPSLHFKQPNEHINFNDSPFYVNTDVKNWDGVNGKRLAAISSFGFSGTNAHLVIEDYPVKTEASVNEPPVIIPVSAKSERQLKTSVKDLKNYLQRKEYHLDQISYTLQTGRKAHEYRVAFIAWDANSLIKLLEEYLAGNTSDQVYINEGKLTSRSANTSKNLTEIASNWVIGQSVEWKKLYNATPTKVSLPTYPFEKVRCWIERKVEQVSKLIVSNTITRTETKEESKVVLDTQVESPSSIQINEIKSFLRKELADILYIEESKITDQKEFSSIGLDSVVGVEVINKINSAYDLKMEAQVFYDFPTINQLANFIAGNNSDKQIVENQIIEEKVKEVKTTSKLTNKQEVSQIKDFLREKLSGILYLDQDQIADQKEFSKIGLDSVVGVELINVINSEYGIALEASCLYEFKNLLLLTDHVVEELGFDYTPDNAKTASNEIKEEIQNIADTSEIKSFLRTQLSKILFLEENKIGDETKFSSIGLDSVVGVELVQVINDQYQVTIEAGSLYDYNNLNTLAEIVGKNVAPSKEPEKPRVIKKHKEHEPVKVVAEEKKVQIKLINEPFLVKPVTKTNGKITLKELNGFKPVQKSDSSKVKLPEVKLNSFDTDEKARTSVIAVQKTNAGNDAINARATDIQQLAIVGLSGKYPESKDIEKFWNNLKNAKNCITEIPKERWDFQDYYSSDQSRRDKTQSKWGGFIADVDKFSPLFFNLSPRESENMDPQERLLLEVIWATIEDAGYTPNELKKVQVGVFIGNMINQYSLVTNDQQKSAAIINGSNWSLANRLSFFYDFKGPSLVINTACSSSLTAIYMACESIKRGECKYALAGGVNLNLHPSKWIGLSNGGMIGNEGMSQSLGNGTGYIPGEGVGTVLIKPLADAIADKDHIYGVIKGGYINHGGRSTGFTVPNLEGQTQLAEGIFRAAGISPSQIDYIETASNGSQVGDPIEIKGLINTFKNVQKSIPIGTVKSNIGHCEAASGISQVTKVLLQYQYNELVPSINSEPMNPAIDLKETPFYVQKEVSKINVKNEFNTLINSFGAGGSNAQLIISNFDQQISEISKKPIKTIIPLSAEDLDGIRRVAGNLLAFLSKNSKETTFSLEHIAYTLQVGREALEQRMIMQAESVSELVLLLKNYLKGNNSDKVFLNESLTEEEKKLSSNEFNHLREEVEKGKFQKLIENWLSGYEINWKAFYGDQFPQKISLPTYPFLGERYWAGELEAISNTSENENAVLNGKKQNGSPLNDTKVTVSKETVKEIKPLTNGKIKATAMPVMSVNAGDDQLSKLVDFIKGVCCDLLKIPIQKMSSRKPFSNYGIDSILVKDISIQLEKALGNLPKTLFFQCANVDELADYLLKKHQKQVADFIGSNDFQKDEKKAIVSETVTTGNFLHSKESLTDSQKTELTQIGGIHFANGYLLDIWTSVYIANDKSGYLHTLELTDEKVIYGASYLGNPDNEIKVLAELNQLAAENGYQFCFWSVNTADQSLEKANQWISTPVGVWQNIEEISNFTLEGGKMKKLRYMVNKFENLGDCKTVEYTELSEQVDQEIKEVVMEWCKNKKYVHSVKPFIEDLNSGNWKERYRIFLTYQADKLQNIILIGELPGNGYLMDQEYYKSDMPMGGTEFTVSQIIKKTAEEGSEYFSLGMTWVLVANEYVSDEAGYQVIKNANEKDTFLAKVFENADKNLQYKNKFRPVNKPGYFYRPADSDPELLIRFLSLFMEQGVPSEEIAQLLNKPVSFERKREEKNIELNNSNTTVNLISEEKDAFFDVSKVSKESVRIDLMSDSWVYFRNNTVKERIGELIGRVEEYTNYREVIDELFGFDQVQISQLGRVSEKLFFGALGKRYNGKVLSNLVFYTTAHHISDNGFQLIEIPDQKVYNLGSGEVFRGGFDMEKLKSMLADESETPAMIFLELCNNGSGGYPVSMAHLKEVYQLAVSSGLPLVVDMTRIIRNAVLVQKHEHGYQDKSIREIVQETCQKADMLVGSVSKDFCVNVGGLIAVKDASLLAQIKGLAKMEGGFVSELEMGVIGESIKDFDYLEAAVKDQLKKVDSLSKELLKSGIPIVLEASGHCLLIPVNQIKALIGEQYPKELFLKELWETTGIRGGIHIPGQKHDTNLNECVRLCLPLGLTNEEEQILLKGLTSLKSINKFSESSYKQADNGHNETQLINEPMAIIGMSGKYPQAENVEQFWDNIKEGKSCTGPIEGIRKVNFEGENIKAGFMSDVDLFDPLFFNISPKEARLMDPQQRLILEKSWEAMEDSGYTREIFAESTTGVFIAIPQTDYMKYDEVSESVQTTGTVSSIASSRISHSFNLTGPSEVYNTNCSSSFVALHRAIQSIRLGECDQAIVGGVQVIIGKEEIKSIAALGVLSESGTSLSFDHKADGYVRSEGVGAMIIKPLAKAEEQGDHIYALVKGTAVGHGGTGLSLTAPSAKGIAEVMKKAYRNADIDPRTVQYVEAHGISATTPDAIELDAIQSAYTDLTENQSGDFSEFHCKIGAIKPVIGHAEFASGMAILTKVVKALQHRIIPGIPGFEQLNDEISLDEKVFELTAENKDWKAARNAQGKILPRRASLNSYGTGGVNAHVILEEYQGVGRWSSPANCYLLFVLSADNLSTLKTYADRFISFIQKRKHFLNLEQLAFTLQMGREARAERVAIIFNSIESLLASLSNGFESHDLKGKLFTGNADENTENSNLPADEEITNALLEKKKAIASYTTLATAWVNGLAVDWKQMYDDQLINKISLPTYPFDKKSYWVHQKVNPSVEVKSTNVSEEKPAEEFSDHNCSSLSTFMVDYLSGELELEKSAIKMDKRMIDFGVDSIIGQKLGKELLDKFQVKVKGREMLDHQTIDSLAQYLTEKINGSLKKENSGGEEQTLEVVDEIEALEKFKRGELSLQEIEKLV